MRNSLGIGISLMLACLPVQFVVCGEVTAQSVQDRKAEADRLLGKGNQLNKVSKYREALQTFEQALLIYREIKNRNGEGDSFISLGNVYKNLGQYQKAIDFYQQSLVIKKEIGDRYGEGNSLIGLGNTYYFLGQYQKAIDFYQQSSAIKKEIGDRNGEVASLIGLGNAYYSLGQYQKTIEYHQQSLAITKGIGDVKGKGASLIGLGNAYYSLGQYQKAIEYHQQSLALAKEIGDRKGEGRSVNNLGNAYYSLRQYQKAIEYHQQSFVIKKEIGDRNGEGKSLNNLGNAYYSLGQYQKAIDFYQQSLALKKEVGDRDGEGNSLSNLGLSFAKLKQPELAILFYKQSINVRESIRNDIRGLSKEDQKSYLSTVESSYRSLADLLLKQDRILEAQQVLDLLKVQELSDYLRTVRGNSQTAKGVDLQRPEQNLIASIGEFNTLKQKDRENNLSETEQQRLAQLVQSEKEQNKQFNLFLNSDEIQKLIRELSRVEQDSLEIKNFRSLRSDVLAKMPKAVILYPLILDDRLELVLVIANAPPIRRTVKVTRTEFNAAILQFRGNLLDQSSDDVKVTAQKLYNWMIQPFESELQQLKIDTIIYAPDGQLRYVPLAALYDGKQWLVEKYRVNNITAQSLSKFNNTKTISKPHIFAGAFGGKGGEKRSGFSGLPATLTEVKTIAARFPDSTTLVESAFTKLATEVKAKSFNILHLATHGELSISSPEQSFILFGNGDKVTISELQDWSLSNVDLVVLSACQTGLGGKLGTGVEILGLGYQMQAAGARSAIASLWVVDDAGTQSLMGAFYGELQKGDVTISEALRRSQVSLIRSKEYNHPYYWSAFFAIGNGL